jgi:phosphoribosylformylglycinamidine (FGAM) synthase-like enzyme
MAAPAVPGEAADLYAAVHAVGMELCPVLGITIPVGKDSLSMRSLWTEGQQRKQVTAPVSLIVSAFASLDDVRGTLTPQLDAREADTTLILIDLGRGRLRMGGVEHELTLGAETYRFQLDQLMLRVGSEAYERTLAERHVRPMDSMDSMGTGADFRRLEVTSPRALLEIRSRP